MRHRPTRRHNEDDDATKIKESDALGEGGAKEGASQEGWVPAREGLEETKKGQILNATVQDHEFEITRNCYIYERVLIKLAPVLQYACHESPTDSSITTKAASSYDMKVCRITN